VRGGGEREERREGERGGDLHLEIVYHHEVGKERQDILNLEQGTVLQYLDRIFNIPA
jgi:hypothetical protein